MTFLRSRSFLAALQGERLRPADVDACPELPSAPRLAKRLLTSRFATLSGGSGTGKSVTAFHAARRLNRRGWKVVELMQAGIASAADVEEFQHMRGPVLAVVDDAQAIDTNVLSEFQSSMDDDHAVLLISTDRLEARNDETLLAHQSTQILHDYCLANIDEVGALLSQLDDRVRWSAFAEHPDHRLQVAASTTNEPWLYMFVASGGERRIAGALDRAVDDLDAALVLGAVCISQMISRDAGVTRPQLLEIVGQQLSERAPAESLDLEDRLDRALLSLSNERLIREHDTRIRAVHMRVAERALQNLAQRDTDGVGDAIRSYVRSALLSCGNDVAGKFWLLRVFDHYDVYRDRFAESIVDGDVAAELLRECLESAPGSQRGAALSALWTSRWFRPLTAGAAEQLATAIVDWLPRLEASEVNGFRWNLNELRGHHKLEADRIRAAADPRILAARLSSAGNRRSAHDWANVLQEVLPDWDDDDWLTWSEQFEQGIDPNALSEWLNERDDYSHPFEIYELIDALAGFAPRAAEIVFRACAQEIRDAMTYDVADATGNFAEWTFGNMSLVARMANAPSAADVEEGGVEAQPDDQGDIRHRNMDAKESDLRALAATVLSTFERVDWVASARSLDGKPKFQLHNLDLLVAWLSYLSTDITDRLAIALPSGWLLGIVEETRREQGDDNPFGAIGLLLYELSSGPRGETVVRTFLEDNDSDITTLPSPLVRRFPDIAARLIGEGRNAEPSNPHGLGWAELTAQLRAIADVDREAAGTWLGRIANVVTAAFCNPQTHDLNGVAAFIDLADYLDQAVLDAVVGRIDAALVEAAWTARWADSRHAVRPLFDRVLRVEGPAADLASAIVCDRTGR